MKESELIEYIEKPELLVNCDIKQLKYLVYNFPFFQTAHILYLKALLIQDKDQFDKQLTKSSTYISDRDLLFKYLNQEIELKEELKDQPEPTQKDSDSNKNLLKNKNIKRRINSSFEGMGENISETISSQIEFSNNKEKDKLEYPSEIYFIDEERDGRNNIITIDADPEDIKKLKKKKDILQIDEKELKKQKERKDSSSKSDKIKKEEKEPFELIETDEIKGQDKSKKTSAYFDINEYEEKAEPIKDDLISKFIKENPRIKAKEVKEEVKDISQDSIKEDSNLLSETLIKVYIKQGLFDKAIESYKKLSLKYPEKSTYFASQIKILEDKINN
jgi:hypothetical protein